MNFHVRNYPTQVGRYTRKYLVGYNRLCKKEYFLYIEHIDSLFLVAT